MNHLKLIHEYIRDRGTLADIPATGFPFVTISREAGAGAHLLSYVLLADLLKEPNRKLFEGWHVFNRQLCELIAADPALHNGMQALIGEKCRSEFREFMDGLFTGHAQQYEEYKKAFEVVRTLATLGKVILVGRAAVCVTRGLPAGVHVRLVASEPVRIRRMMGKLRIDKEAARAHIHEQDAERRRVVKKFFGREIDDVLLYDAVWNTETVNPQEISAAVIAMVKSRASPPKP